MQIDEYILPAPSDVLGHGAWVVSNHTWPADPAYYQNSLSNGSVWPIVLSEALGISSELGDKAVDGATSDNTVVQGYTGVDLTIPAPSMIDQIAQYIAKTPASFDNSDSLYAIVIGANDIFFDPRASAQCTVQTIKEGMKQLQENEGKLLS